MKSSKSRWVKLMSIRALSAMLLSIGAGPAAAVTTCRPGYIEAAPGLCISQVARSATEFSYAMNYCHALRGRVASYGDLFYIYQNNPALRASYNPNGKWIGPDLVGDDQALCGNADVTGSPDLDIYNFEGTCGKWEWWHQYWCAHDLD